MEMIRMKEVFKIPGENDYKSLLEKVDITERAQVKCGACESCTSACGGTSKCK